MRRHGVREAPKSSFLLLGKVPIVHDYFENVGLQGNPSKPCPPILEEYAVAG